MSDEYPLNKFLAKVSLVVPDRIEDELLGSVGLFNNRQIFTRQLKNNAIENTADFRNLYFDVKSRESNAIICWCKETQSYEKLSIAGKNPRFKFKVDVLYESEVIHTKYTDTFTVGEESSRKRKQDSLEESNQLSKKALTHKNTSPKSKASWKPLPLYPEHVFFQNLKHNMQLMNPESGLAACSPESSSLIYLLEQQVSTQEISTDDWTDESNWSTLSYSSSTSTSSFPSSPSPQLISVPSTPIPMRESLEHSIDSTDSVE